MIVLKIGGNRLNRCRYDKEDHQKQQKNCIKETLSSILEAQKKAMERDDCDHSCQESLKCLLGEKKKSRKNTVPFILFCNCKPFKATGAKTYLTPSKKKKFVCITSFIFKIKDIKGDCAVLELLTFKQKHSHHSKKRCNCGEFHSPCCQLNDQHVDHLRKTGICINVDLSNFNAVTCLPAVELPPR